MTEILLKMKLFLRFLPTVLITIHAGGNRITFHIQLNDFRLNNYENVTNLVKKVFESNQGMSEYSTKLIIVVFTSTLESNCLILRLMQKNDKAYYIFLEDFSVRVRNLDFWTIRSTLKSSGLFCPWVLNYFLNFFWSHQS